MSKKLTVVDWVPYGTEAEKEINALGGFFNFHEIGQRWKDYIDRYDQDTAPYLECVREAIVKNNFKFSGHEHQYNEDGCPVFSDGNSIQFSQRAWGDLMAAIWSEEENKDYCYVDFAW
jgi:hypothetical protein